MTTKTEAPDAALRRIGRKRAALLEHVELLNTELREAVVAAAASGMSEAAMARESGATRMTVRKWLGKQ